MLKFLSITSLCLIATSLFCYFIEPASKFSQMVYWLTYMWFSVWVALALLILATFMKKPMALYNRQNDDIVR